MSEIDYTNMFNKDILTELVDSGKNTVISYPAGTGKTTAILEYLKEHRYDTRKIIYIAPTCTLLDTMYEELIKIGVPESLIFNYHSKSKQLYKVLHIYGHEVANEEEVITDRIKNSTIILITHKRMMFESATRFMGNSDLMIGRKPPLVFIDEAIEPVNIACIKTMDLDHILRDAKVISPTDTVIDFKINQKWNQVTNSYETLDIKSAIDFNHKLINAELCKPVYRMKSGNWRMGFPSERNVNLHDSCGFEVTEYSEVLANRLKCLYWLLSLQIAKQNYVQENNAFLINLPIALHLMWQFYGQIIVMDATAYLSPSLYEGFELIKSNDWNWNKIDHKVFHHKILSKSKIKENPEVLPLLLNSIDFNKHNKIYVSSCKSFLQILADYFTSKYPEYKIVYSIASPQCIVNNIDYNSDEDYFTSGINPDTGIEYDKIIYITNYGRTRGSNVFRNCDCVLQVGVFRLKPDTLNMINRVYSKLDYNELPLANYIQELYRGTIRCNKPMTAYSIIDEDLYEGISERIPELNITDCNSDQFSTFISDCYVNQNRYGIHGIIIARFYNDLNTLKSDDGYVHYNKKSLSQLFDGKRFDKIRSMIKVIYEKYPEIRKELFSNYNNSEELIRSITNDNGNRHSDIELLIG